MATCFEVYGNGSAQAEERKNALEAVYRERYRRAPAHWFSSSGRAEIVGNHTDHNHGKVLVSAISCDILCAAERRDGNTAELYSEGFRPIRVSLTDLARKDRERGKSSAFVRGVLEYLQMKGYRFGGFRAVTQSTVFHGAGVSSSAAFAVLVAEIVNRLYLGGALSPMEKAYAAQYAENEHFGKPCGLLDQFGVALGGLRKIDFLDPSSPLIDRVPAPAGYSLVLTNTGGSHAKLTSHYAAIRREMGEVAACFGKNFLRDVEKEAFYGELPALRRKTSDRAVLRAAHFFEENERVDRAADALLAGKIPTFLAQVRASGESSLRWLQNCCVPGSDSQPLTLALKLSENVLKTGAFRMMGGGFTGAVFAVVGDGEREAYGAAMARVFGEENVYYAGIRGTGACEVEF